MSESVPLTTGTYGIPVGGWVRATFVKKRDPARRRTGVKAVRGEYDDGAPHPMLRRGRVGGVRAGARALVGRMWLGRRGVRASVAQQLVSAEAGEAVHSPCSSLIAHQVRGERCLCPRAYPWQLAC